MTPLPESSDLALVERSRRGDCESFALLVRRHTRLVFSVCASRMRVEVDEAVQETFFRAWANLRKLEQLEHFRSWLCSIARWVCVEMKRKEKRRPAFLSALEGETGGGWEASGEDPVVESALHNEKEQRLLRALGSLPPGSREVLFLFYNERLPYDEIARIAGITTSAVNMRLTRARKALRGLLGED